MIHTPVLLNEVLEYLDPQQGKVFVDGTANGGGHTKALLAKGAKVIPIELDSDIAAKLNEELSSIGNDTIVINDSYVNMAEIVSDQKVDGVLLDLGFSSWQIDESGRGFSFQRNEPLDMRYGNEGITADEIVNTWAEDEIAKILKEYGEERFDGRIARSIVESRPIHTTFELVSAVERVVRRSGKINPATRIFQALRIAVNHELENVQKGLEESMKILNEKGRIAVISFHSLEDRIVKNYFRKQVKEGHLSLLTKKPVRAEWTEVKTNRRARSAKLRVAERTAPIM